VSETAKKNDIDFEQFARRFSVRVAPQVNIPSECMLRERQGEVGRN
jgi:hypothetical protein